MPVPLPPSLTNGSLSPLLAPSPSPTYLQLVAADQVKRALTSAGVTRPELLEAAAQVAMDLNPKGLTDSQTLALVIGQAAAALFPSSAIKADVASKHSSPQQPQHSPTQQPQRLVAPPHPVLTGTTSLAAVARALPQPLPFVTPSSSHSHLQSHQHSHSSAAPTPMAIDAEPSAPTPPGNVQVQEPAQQLSRTRSTGAPSRRRQKAPEKKAQNTPRARSRAAQVSKATFSGVPLSKDPASSHRSGKDGNALPRRELVCLDRRHKNWRRCSALSRDLAASLDRNEIDANKPRNNAAVFDALCGLVRHVAASFAQQGAPNHWLSLVAVLDEARSSSATNAKLAEHYELLTDRFLVSDHRQLMIELRRWCEKIQDDVVPEFLAATPIEMLLFRTSSSEAKELLMAWCSAQEVKNQVASLASSTEMDTAQEAVPAAPASALCTLFCSFC